MTFVCQKCGVQSEMASDLCKPAAEEAEQKFCGDNALEVCEGNISSMKYRCDACNSVSANPDRLCSPGKLR